MGSLRAVTRLRQVHATLALRLELREDTSCKNAWTDGRVFGYNPHYINLLTDDKLEGLAAHIVMHPACGHHKRRGNRNEKLWNKACDYAINSLLLDAGFTLPDGYLFAEEYSNKNAEYIYDALLQGENEKEAEKHLGDEDSDSHAEVENGDQDSKDAEPDDSFAEQNAVTESAESAGEVRDDPGGETSDARQTYETDWEEAFIQAVGTARDLGKLPAGIERLLQKRLNPKLSWQELLARFIERSARSDYSWVTPNRRYLHQGIYLPAIQNNELHQLVVAIDTSGSIQADELDQFIAELQDILAQTPTTTHIFFCDTEIQQHLVIEQADMLQPITPKGGGGTDYRPVFTAIERQGLRPACMIYLTDLECVGYPEHEPAFPVLWVKTGDASKMPPFGDIIPIRTEYHYAD